MQHVHVVVELDVELGSDAQTLERDIADEGRRAARELYGKALAELDRQAVRKLGGARQRMEDRWPATLVGRLRLRRYRVRAGKSSFHPLDRILGLEQGEASPALRRTLQILPAASHSGTRPGSSGG